MTESTEWIEDLCNSEEDIEITYAWVVPCHNGEVAWLIPVHRDTYIRKGVECWCKDGSKQNPLHQYLQEIKSGKGNWIISPQNDNSDLKWSELDYANAQCLKRVSRVYKEHVYHVEKV